MILEQTTAQVIPQLINVHVGQPAKFECRGTGINITLSWRALQRHNISSKAHILNNQLIFPSVSMQDSNTYLCVVSSLNGNAFAFVDLHVKRSEFIHQHEIMVLFEIVEVILMILLVLAMRSLSNAPHDVYIIEVLLSLSLQ